MKNRTSGRKERSPEPKDVKELRKRHHITQQQLADSLYGVKVERIHDWEREGPNGRNCPPLTWWVMKALWDEVDLRDEEW